MPSILQVGHSKSHPFQRCSERTVLHVEVQILAVVPLLLITGMEISEKVIRLTV